MPFWLKQSAHHKRGMGSAEVVIWEAGRNTGDGSASSFLVFLLVTWVAAGLVGAFLCWCCCLRATPRTVSGDQEAVLAWERLTAKALRFIARRRRLGVAFHSLRDYSLRNNTGSRPTTARRLRRRASTPTPVLHEGPALSNGRPHGGRAQGHQQSG